MSNDAYSFPEFEAAVRTPMFIRLTLACATLALLAALLASHLAVADADSARQGIEEVLNVAGRQRMWSQRIAALGLRRQSVPADAAEVDDALREAVDRFRGDRQRLASLPFFEDDAEAARLHAELVTATQQLLAAREGPALGTAVGVLVDVADRFLHRMESVLNAHQQRGEALNRAVAAARVRSLALAAIASLVAFAAAGEFLARRVARQSARTRQLAIELERLALVSERTDNAVVITDTQGRVQWANEAFTRLSGYALHEALGQSPGALLQFEDTDAATRAAIRQALDARRGLQVEILNRSKLGRVYWLRLDIQPITDLRGECVGFCAVETDITEHVLERQRLAALLAALPAGVVQQDAEGRIVDANPEACRILGLSREQLLGRDSADPRWHTVREDGSPFPGAEHPAMQALRSGVAQRDVMMGLALPSGERRWIRVNAQPLPGRAGAVPGVVSSFVDVTEASSQRRLLNLTIQAARLGTWDWTVPTGRVQFNDVWMEMLGYRPQELAASVSTWEALVHPEDLPAAQARLRQHFAEPAEPYRCEFRMRRSDGRWSWIMAAGAVIERTAANEPQRMVGIHLDITVRKELEGRLADAAMTDNLTGLPNRAALKARLADCAAKARHDPAYRYAVLFLDFDRFKQVNDSLGHEAGDELLRQIAQRLRSIVRPGDDLARLDHQVHAAARLGGDEFVVLLEPLRRPEDAALVAQRLLLALSLPYTIAGRDITSSASIGVVVSGPGGGDPESMLRDADTAMYEAKRRGRGRFVEFSADMHQRVRQALDLEGELRRALRTPGEVHAVYQPIVELATGRIVGAEALARWNHPSRGSVPPAEFVPLAEDSGLIAELGELILQQACRDCQAWQRDFGAEAPRTVAVNLSRAQIRLPDLPDRVARALERAALAPAALRLEITESLAMQDEQIIATLQALRRLGVSLSLDDFGTGYSSLSTLDQMPLDAVKIDRSFVGRMIDSPYQGALIKATVDVASALRLDVIAEGVETPEQARALQAAGCRLAQGWHFGRPVLADEFRERLAQRRLEPHAR